MRQKHQEKDVKIKAIKFGLVVLLLAAFYSLTAGSYGFITIIKTRKEISELKRQQKTTLAHLVDLEGQRKRLEGDLLYIEGVARKHYRLGREGETAISF